ncbi:MAG: hypothetical protein KatS3mg109_1330 [Pirellulaceae bacterium]|nr:MAG: hypothetical protein KatS3mg109_1330 [Pirellulaceae bacterium]
MEATRPPLYHRGQILRILHGWARDVPPRPVVDVQWDACWRCWTYSFPLSVIRIEEYALEPVGLPDIDPDVWLRQEME